MLTAARVWFVREASRIFRRPALKVLMAVMGVFLASASSASAQEAGGGEANLQLPDLSQVSFLGLDGHTLLLFGIGFCILGLIFGLTIYNRLKNLPVHRSMREISELIYETCKTYLITQGKFLMLLEAFIAAVIVLYFGVLLHYEALRVVIILLFSVIGIAGSYGVAWFGIRVNTFANSRTAFVEACAANPTPIYKIPLDAGMSIGMMLISVELLMMLIILLFIPGDYAGACFIGFAIGESLGAAALRIAGGIFTKIADIGSDLMKIVFKDQGRRCAAGPRRDHADCTGDNVGDSVGPSADGFETYGVTRGRAHHLYSAGRARSQGAGAIAGAWIFVMRIAMLVASAAAFFINAAIAKARFSQASPEMNYETPLTTLVWLTSAVSIAMTYVISALIIPELGGDTTQWWKLATIISCGTLAGALIPELVKVFTSTDSRHVKKIVVSAQEGGASLGILSGFVAGNFSSYYLGLAMVALMSLGYLVSLGGLGGLMLAPAVFAFGLVAFGFLGMGPVTIAVDSYGPVTDNAQSVFELSLIEQVPNIKEELKRDFGIDADFGRAKDMLEANDGAGNTFKATAKPVLIGTAVVGATTMIFSIIMALTHGLTDNVQNLSILHAPFFLGFIVGGAMIYWFTGASTQAVTTGAYQAVEFIKNIKLEGVEKASVADSKKVVEICTKYAQKGMLNIFIAVFFAALSFAFVEPFFFIGYLISIAVFGLFQAIFMANAGGAWDNAKKIVEVEMKQKGTPLHDATVIGDTVGDPFKDTSSVALNPVIKFTTLFGLLAVSLAVSLTASQGSTLTHILAAVFFVVSFTFVYRSFYCMRIRAS